VGFVCFWGGEGGIVFRGNRAEEWCIDYELVALGGFAMSVLLTFR